MKADHRCHSVGRHWHESAIRANLPLHHSNDWRRSSWNAFFRVRSLHASAFAPSGESDWSSESELNAGVRIWVCRGGRGGEKRGIPPVGQIFASPSYWSVSDRSFVLHKAGHSSKAAIKSRTFSPIIPLTWTPTPSPADVPAGVVAHFCPVQLSKKDSYICVHAKNVRKVFAVFMSRRRNQEFCAHLHETVQEY